MSAAELREAAALMRSRAEKATPGEWWVPSDTPTWEPTIRAADSQSRRGWRRVGQANFNANAEHIASWHPAVALAVADLLDATAEAHTHTDDGTVIDLWTLPGAENHPALAVARAYLGTTP